MTREEAAAALEALTEDVNILGATALRKTKASLPFAAPEMLPEFAEEIHVELLAVSAPLELAEKAAAIVRSVEE